MAAYAAMDNGLVWVRASINLPDLPIGSRVQVDPTVPYIAAALENGYLQREATIGAEADEREEPEVAGDGDSAVADPVDEAASGG